MLKIYFLPSIFERDQSMLLTMLHGGKIKINVANSKQFNNMPIYIYIAKGI